MTGVQRFAFEICLELLKLDDKIKIIVPKHFKNSNDKLEGKLIYVGQRKGVFWEQIDLAKFIKKEKVVLLNLCNSAPVFYNKSIVAIHDLGVYQNTGWYSTKFVRWYKFMTPRIVKKAISILTVSETVKKELIQHFNLNPENITVVYNGVSHQLVSSESNLKKENIFLHVGSISERKNIQFLVEAFEAADTNGYKLVLCGARDENLNSKLALVNSTKIKWELNCTDEELKDYYSKARYVVCASHYEGFGIPVLEGIANSCKPLLSNILVFNELYDDGALFFYQNNKNDLVKMIEAVTLHPQTIEKSTITKFITNYNYQSAANKIWELLKTIK